MPWRLLRARRALSRDQVPWTGPPTIYAALSRNEVRFVSYVPDAGHKRLIELCQADESMMALPLTTEEEGVGLAMGAWLGGEKSVLLLQSSGVGNLVNALGAVGECGFPLFMLVTMRGEEGEFNPWQVPMGVATPSVLEAMGVVVERVTDPHRAGAATAAGLELAFREDKAVALLISQSLIGIKSFQEQVDR